MLREVLAGQTAEQTELSEQILPLSFNELPLYNHMSCCKDQAAQGFIILHSPLSSMLTLIVLHSHVALET